MGRCRRRRELNIRTYGVTAFPSPPLRQPVRGFGKVWREQLGGQVTAIGWATDAERGLDGFVQEWNNGLVLRLGVYTVVLLRDGSWGAQ